MENISYPGISIIISKNSSKKFEYIKDDYSVRIICPFFTILFIKKNLEDMFDSYISMMSDRIKELESYVQK